MLAIRLQRTGRKGYATYRVIVQEAHRQPTSGRVVANIGTYNPHTKDVTLDTEKAEFYLKNGAQPSGRVVKLLQAEKVTLPDWVETPDASKQKTIKNAEKLRKNQPKEEAAPESEAETATVEATAEQEAAENVSEGVSTEQIADAEVADGQVTAEEEVAADAAPEAADPSDDAEDQAEKPAK